jgi:26S proteasome regulatory subunit T5
MSTEEPAATATPAEGAAPAEGTSALENADIFGEDDAMKQIDGLSADEINLRARMLQSDIHVMGREITRMKHELEPMKEKIAGNIKKIDLNRQLPHLVCNIAEILEMPPEEEDDGAIGDSEKAEGPCVVLKTTTRQTVFLPIIGLVPHKDLKPMDLVGANKDSYLVLDKLPPEYDSRVQGMEVDEKPVDQYSDIGGADKQIQEMVEAIVLPMTHKERFEAIGIKPPKGLLLFGAPGTGKTMMARACAAQTNATFLKLAGPQLVQMFIGDGAKIVRDAFALAREKAPAIIFIDEIDAIGMKRSSGGELSGIREVQRTMLELLNQLDGFSSSEMVKVIAATNRPDSLDPALLRSGRLDRKVELPLPNEDARARIMQIHSRKMNVNKDDVNFSELARSTDDFNGAQLKAVCVEAGMEALRRAATELTHEDYVNGIQVVQAKKKKALNYFT